MASLKALKNRISSVKSTQKITKAMKMVAAAKLRRAQAAAEAARPYAERMAAMMSSLASKVTPGPGAPKLLAGTGNDQTHLLIVCTSDGGLAGAFNSNIVRAARKQGRRADQPKARRSISTWSAARAARRSSACSRRRIIHHYDTSADARRSASTTPRRSPRDMVDRFITDGIDVAHLFYARFQSALVQDTGRPADHPRATGGACG